MGEWGKGLRVVFGEEGCSMRLIVLLSVYSGRLVDGLRFNSFVLAVRIDDRARNSVIVREVSRKF